MAVIFGGINALAQDEVEVKELTVDMFHKWTGFDQDAVCGDVAPDQVFNVGNAVSVGDGGVICGNASVANDIYADLTGGTKLIIEGTAGMVVAVNLNRQANGDLEKITLPIGENGTLEIDLTSYPYVHINTIKANWGSPSGVITSIKYVMPVDKLALPKTHLKNEISTAKMYNPIAYTEQSFGALQKVISDGETALTATGATQGSLSAAKDAISNAITDLVLAEGYSILTKEMFKDYKSVTDPSEGDPVSETANITYELFKSIGTPYGDGNVSETLWADLKGYDYLVVTVNQGVPRFCINRLQAGGQQGGTQAESKMLDINPNNNYDWSTKAYQTVSEDKTVYKIDINKIVNGDGDYTGYNFARLHCIKGAHYGDVLVTGFYLYKSTNELEVPQNNLKNAIENAKNCDTTFKTEDSLKALNEAITKGEDTLKKATTKEALEAATNAITAAITTLEFQPGYSNFDPKTFKAYNSLDDTGEGSPTTYNFTLFEHVGQVLGGASMSELEWADLTDYDKLILTVKEGTPRISLNRTKFSGTQGDTMKDSELIDIKTENTDTWSYKRYLTVNDNVYTVNLTKVTEDWGFARLNSMKFAGTITGLYLYKAPNRATEYDLTFDVDDPTHIAVTVNGTPTTVPASKVLKVADRAKITVSQAEGYKLTSFAIDGEDVELPENGLLTYPRPFKVEDKLIPYTKAIVNTHTFNITTAKDDPFSAERADLKVIINNAKLYDGTARTAESFKNLTDAIAAAETEWAKEPEDTSKEALNAAGTAINTAINGLVFAEGYSHLTPDMFKKYSSVETPDAGEAINCEHNTFEYSLVPYGDKSNSHLNWADLSNYDQLIVTVHGDNAPCFYMNRTEEGGQQAATKEESKMIHLNSKAAESWSSVYHNVDGNTYTVNLKNIVKEHGSARLHSIQNAEHEKQVFATGMYLYKAPFVAVTEIILNKTDEQLKAGETLQLTATVAPSNATDPTIVWTSSDTKVAKVDATGKVTAVKVGNAVITAKAGEKTATCKIEVVPVPVTGLEVQDEDHKPLESGVVIPLHTGDNYDLTAVVSPANATDKTVTWTSSDAAVAEVDANGLIETHKAGETTITATIAQFSFTVKVTVTDPVIPITGITLNKTKADMVAGETLQLTATIAPEDASSKEVGWKSSDESIATVDRKGLVTAKKAGKVTISATANKITATCEITITAIEVESITLDKTAETILVGENLTLHATVTPANATEPTVTWTSSDESIAIVDEDGIVTGLAMGKVTITAEAGGKTATCTLTVTKSTGVDALDSDNEMQVYDLNGHYVGEKVEGLKAGIYIVRQGNSAKKLVVR